MPNCFSTPARTSSASLSRSALVPPRFTSASACRVEIPAPAPTPPPPRPRYPFGNPACSTSHAARTLTPPSAGNEAMSFQRCARSAQAAATHDSTLPCGEDPAGEVGAVEAFDALQALGDLLAVGAHVLDRRAADRPGDPRQALDSGPTACHHGLHQPVPNDPGAGAHLRARPVAQLDSTDGEAQDESGEP